MKALSLHQPWAWLVAGGLKDVENRPWRTWYRGLLAIRATRDQGPSYYAEAVRQIAEISPGLALPDRRQLAYGSVIGLVNVRGCERQSESPWFWGPWGWALIWARRIDEPVACRGQRGIWTLPLDVAYEVVRRDPHW